MRKENHEFDEQIEEMLAGLLPPAGSVESTQHTMDEGQAEIYTRVSEAPIGRIVNTILMHAIEDGTKEIEIVPTKNRIDVRWEVDGVVEQRMKIPTYVLAPLIRSFKILGDMDVEECQAAQTGNAHIKMRDKDYNLHIQTSLTELGEKVVVGISEIVVKSENRYERK